MKSDNNFVINVVSFGQMKGHMAKYGDPYLELVLCI